MEMFGNFGSNSDLSSSIGLSNTGNQFWNLTPAELVEDTILQGEGLLTDTGALAMIRVNLLVDRQRTDLSLKMN